MSERQSFRQVYCDSRRVVTDRFEITFLKEVLYPLGKPLSLTFLALRPSIFSHELALINAMGQVDEFDSFASRRNVLIDYTLYQLAPWRKTVGLRVSGRKLLDIGNQLDSDRFKPRNH